MISERRPSDVVAGQYRLVQRIGSGGFAEVWEAEQVMSSQRCALKILKAAHLSDRVMVNRFQREAAILGALDHPIIARALGYEIDGGVAYIAMELVEGITLGRALRTRARSGDYLPARTLLGILKPIIDALTYAHERGVVHRDLKPGNIILTKAGGVRLVDFGIAKMLTAPADLETTVGRLIGSKHYLSPEQIRYRAVGPPADVFALASTVFLMITHHLPWVHDDNNRPLHYANLKRTGVTDFLEIVERICHAPRPRASDCREGIAPELDAVLVRATAIDPADRYATPAEFYDALVEVLDQSEAFTRLVDADEDLQTVVATQWVEDWMVLDDGDDDLEILDVQDEPKPAAVALPRPRPRWGIVVAALVFVGSIATLGVILLAMTPLDAPPPPPPSVAARPARTPSVVQRAQVRPRVPPPAAVPPTPERPAPPPPNRVPTKVAPVRRPSEPTTRLERAVARLERGEEGAFAYAQTIIESDIPKIADADTRTAVKRCVAVATVMRNDADLLRCARLLRSAARD